MASQTIRPFSSSMQDTKPTDSAMSGPSLASRKPFSRVNINRERTIAQDDAKKPAMAMLKEKTMPLNDTRSRVCANEPTVSPVDTSENREGVEEELNSSIFRTRTAWQAERSEMEDMWTLKRANPIAGASDDELEDEYASPSKRARTTVLSWEHRILDDDDDDEPIVLLSSARTS